MLKGIDLQALAAKIVAQKELKRDFIADTAEARMVVQSDNKPALLIPQHGEFPILPLAHDQIGARSNIPAKYYDRMLAEKQTALLAHNVNTWWTAKPERRMVRTLGGDTRAFLSNMFQRIEHEEIAEVALPILFDLPGVQIPSCEVTDRRLYIHFVVPTVQGEVKRGDIVQAGGIITNSEVGCGAVSVSGLLWRLECLNGMKSSHAFRRNHVGRRVEDDGEMDWANDTRAADDRAVLLKVRDMVRAVVDQTRFNAELSKMQALTTGVIEKNPASAVEVLAAKVGLLETERAGVLMSLVNGGDLSRWGILNAVTAQAHTATSYDRAVELEALGGKLLDLPAGEWREVLQAA